MVIKSKSWADARERRYGLSFASFYGVDHGQRPIRFPDERTMVVTHQG